MAEKTEHSAGTSDSFEELLRKAAHPPHVSRRSTLPSGTKLAGGRFEITRRIGEGGMGVVYEAFDAERRRKVALKTLSRLEPASIYGLKNEFRALADVSHPNLVRLHELFADDALWFFTMDLVDGVRFDAWVRPEGALHETRLRAALPELLQAVLAIHDAGKLHRDLKPSNVLVTREGRVVVLDFGLAVDPQLGGVGQTVADESVSGTPAYMAPEQAAGQPATAASDFYALGVMLFEAVTGKLPFEGRVGEMLAAKQTRPAPPMALVNPNAPALLAEMGAALLALDPSARSRGAALLEQLDAGRAPSASRHTRASHAPDAGVELVGRDAELAALRDAYSVSVSGDKPVIVLLSGESGIGKSALLERFLGEMRAQDRAVVLSGRCYERESVPFKGFDALIDELSRYLRKQSAVDAATLIPRDAYALRQLFPVLGRIDAIAQAPERDIPDPFELRRRGFLALGELLGRIRDRRLLVLAIDDLQWSDLDSTTLLLHLVRQADAPRVLLVLSHRSENMRQSAVLQPIYETLEVDSRLDVRQLALGSLADEAADALLPAEYHDRRKLLREAAGNPFLLRELSRAGEAAAGQSLAEILRARVAVLPREQRALLEVLAVAARPLSLELAAEAAGVLDQARAAFDALRSAQLARSSMQPGCIECYHDKVRESVATGVGAEQARSHHAALAAALMHARDADPEHLALHFELAGEARLAAEHASRAANHALRSFAFEQAARLYQTALTLGAFDAAEAQRMQVAFGDALARAGRGPEAADAYLRACEGPDQAKFTKLRGKAIEQYLYSGRIARARELLGESLQFLGMALPRSPSAAGRALALEHARLRLRGWRFRRAEPTRERDTQLAARAAILAALAGPDPLASAALNVQVLRQALDAGDARVALSALHTEIHNRLFELGDPSKLPELLQYARALTEELADPTQEAWLHLQLAAYEHRGRPNGDFDAALDHVEQCFTAVRADPRRFHAHYRSGAYATRSQLLALVGRFEELARELPAQLDEVWQRSDLIAIPGYHYGPNLAWLALGAQSEAMRELERATRAWSALGNPYAAYDVYLHVGRVWLCHDRGDARAAWARCLDDERRFRVSSVPVKQGFPAIRMRAQAAATLAADTKDSSERKQLLRAAERVPLNVSKPMRSWFLLSRAAAACARRDRERAVRLLRELDAGPRPPAFAPIYVHATRRRLGVLLGGDEGKALVVGADAFFRQGGTIDPERFVATILPGCEIR